MRKLFFLALLIMSAILANAQATAPLFVGGDIDKFYPVVFQDNNWNNNVATELEIGRSGVHIDESWRGSVIAKFRFHTTRWGNGSNFFDVDIQQNKDRNDPREAPLFIAGYRDATGGNASFSFIVWLRGNTTYYCRSNAPQVPEVYDGVKNPLPYNESGNSPLTYKTGIDSYVNRTGKSYDGTLYTHGPGLNYMFGDLALGTTDTKGYKLSVKGKIRTQEILVEAPGNWPDYVFAKDYKLTPLSEVENYIKTNQHLPEMPAAAQVEKEGISLGDMNKKLVQKIEELTLHLIEQDKQLKTQQATIQDLSEKVLKLSNERNSFNKK